MKALLALRLAAFALLGVVVLAGHALLCGEDSAPIAIALSCIATTLALVLPIAADAADYRAQP